MINTRILLAFLLTCTTSLVSFSPLRSQTPPTTPETNDPTKDLKTVTQVLDEMCSFLKDHKSFSVEMDVTYDNVLDSGQKVQYSAYQRIGINKPNQLRSDYIGDQRDTRFYYDGKSFTLHFTDSDFYTTKPAASTIDETIDQIEEQYDISIPLSNLFKSDPCQELKLEIQDSKFIGVDMVNRVPGYHLLFTGTERDFQLWVTRDPQPLLMKIIISYKNLPGEPQYTAILSNWNFKPSFKANTFIFEPPKDAYQIEILPTENDSKPE